MRPPNLFTVPGDVLAGAALAGLGTGNVLLLVPAIFASLLLYASGLILNDYMDRDIDARERPARPVPSGRVSAAGACAASLACMGTAVVLALLTGITQFWITAGVLSGLILLYNGPARSIPVAGFAVMGLCRGCNVLLGASIMGGLVSPPALIGAGVETLYIFCVTWLAHGEVDTPPGRRRWWLPPAIILAASPIVLLCLGTFRPIVMIPLVVLLAWLSTRLTQADPTPKKIGVLIRGLILLQILLITFSISHTPAWFSQSAIGILIVLFIIAEGLSRRFHGS